ncbi:MAG TPA: site-specific integrase [Pedobacter sp.]|jgi:integrase
MRTSNTFGIHFLIRPDKLKEGKAPVYARVTVNAERILIGLKQWIEPRAWDARKGIGKGAKSETLALNNYLSEIRVELGECYRELQLKKQVISAIDIKNIFHRIEVQDYTLTALFKYHNEKEKHSLASNTLSHYKTSQLYILRFVAASLGKKDLSLKEINFKFLADFENFLRDYKPEGHKKTIGNSGAMTHLIRLKKMINLAINLDWMQKNPFNNYKIKFQHEQRVCLDQVELANLERKAFTLYRLDYVRDLFVFCCYTGLAYVDAMNLTPQHLAAGVDGDIWIKTYRQKTRIPVNTPLLPKASEILAKYQHDPRAINSERLFPVMSIRR